MFVISKAILSLSCRRVLNMPEINSADLRVIKSHILDGETLITSLKEEIKQLMEIAVKSQESKKIKYLKDENKRLQNEINLVKQELIQLQIANGVPQIPIPGDNAEPQEPTVTPSPAETTKPEKVAKPDNAPSAAKPAKATKPKKQAEPTADEAPADVGKLDIRVGRITQAQVHPDADQLYVEHIDVGEETTRTVVSGLVKHVPLAELDQRMVLVLCNLKPQKMRGVLSQAMVLCASTPEKVELLSPPSEAKAGDTVSVPGYPRVPDLPFMNPKKKIFEKVAEDLKVNSKKEASFKDVPWRVDGKEGFITSQTLSGCFIK